jgi:hypothetical protein
VISALTSVGQATAFLAVAAAPADGPACCLELAARSAVPGLPPNFSQEEGVRDRYCVCGAWSQTLAGGGFTGRPRKFTRLRAKWCNDAGPRRPPGSSDPHAEVGGFPQPPAGRSWAAVGLGCPCSDHQCVGPAYDGNTDGVLGIEAVGVVPLPSPPAAGTGGDDVAGVLAEAGVLMAAGDAGGGDAGFVAAPPPERATLVTSVQSMGRKYTVGAPFDRIWSLPPW